MEKVDIPVFEIHTDDDHFYIHEDGIVTRFDAISGSEKKEGKCIIINRIPNLIREEVARLARKLKMDEKNIDSP